MQRKGKESMKRFFKLLATAVCAMAMVFALAACSSGTDDASKGDDTAKTEESGKGLSIVIISSSGIDDGSFTQNVYEGIESFVKDHSDCTVTDVKESDMDKLIPTVESLVADYDVFVLPGFNFAAIGDIAAANPDKYFIVVDSTITDSEGNAMSLDNVYTMTFREQESGFYAGVAAALETKTGKVAVVNGMAFPSNVNYQKGFESGVNYSNKHYGTDAELIEIASYAGQDVAGNDIGGNYVGGFGDEAGGKVVGQALIDQGVDVMLVAAGASGNGVFTAAKENPNIFVIGCDTDQYDDGANGDSNIILTSTLKVMDINVDRVLNEIYDGNFKGADDVLGADTQSTGIELEDGRHQLSPETIEKLQEVKGLVESGEIVPAADVTVNEYSPEDFPGLN